MTSIIAIVTFVACTLISVEAFQQPSIQYIKNYHEPLQLKKNAWTMKQTRMMLQMANDGLKRSDCDLFSATTTSSTKTQVDTDDDSKSGHYRNTLVDSSSSVALAAFSTLLMEQSKVESANAAVSDLFSGFQGISQGTLDPSNFQPVCPASDGFYRVLQSSTVALVGKENFVEYGPLIAGGLLRVRLELCVVESFFNEAVGPFIAENGLNWILPIHETVETFLAGGIFAVATTFILIGSTKLLTVIATYTDFLLGFPSRLVGGFVFDRAQGKPVTLDVGIGPWFQTRVIGPADTKAGEVPVIDFKVTEASPPELIVLFLSGIVKVFGEVLGVRYDTVLLR
jgi:hypothetical protein